ncbi:MAG TPA: nucleotide exchange factor GrpE [Coriobacteriia bacterium]|nr:nucleotide exchange factor GrpE [Coriobacteriia bacterium]
MTDYDVDPELEADLGPELEIRGDVIADELETAKAEVEQWRDTALRAQAEFENSRKRLEVRHADALLRASERVVSELLPVIDDFERAIDHIGEGNADAIEGLVAVHRKLLAVLAKEGVAPIDPLDQPFDADKHNAVQMQEDAEVPDHTVVAVFQKGYEMHGRVLRPAMVVVSTGGPGK